MGKTLTDVDLQVRQLIGDFQRVNFTEAQVTEAINWAQDAIMRIKGFKIASRLYDLTTYPTGDLATDTLVVKRVQLVLANSVTPYYTIVVTPSVPPMVPDSGSQYESVTVTITPFNGYGDSISVFVPMNLAGSDGAGLFVNSPTSLAAHALGNWVGDVAQNTPGQSGLIYTNVPYGGAAYSFNLEIYGTTQGWNSINYQSIFLTGLSTINVNSNHFTMSNLN